MGNLSIGNQHIECNSIDGTPSCIHIRRKPAEEGPGELSNLKFNTHGQNIPAGFRSFEKQGSNLCFSDHGQRKPLPSYLRGRCTLRWILKGSKPEPSMISIATPSFPGRGRKRIHLSLRLYLWSSSQQWLCSCHDVPNEENFLLQEIYPECSSLNDTFIGCCISFLSKESSEISANGNFICEDPDRIQLKNLLLNLTWT